MLRRLSILIASGALVLAVSGGAAFAGDKAGAVQATSGSTCVNPDLQDNQFSGEIYVFLHDPNADGYDVDVTYHKSGNTVDGELDLVCSFDGWYLYETGRRNHGGGRYVSGRLRPHRHQGGRRQHPVDLLA